MQVLQSRPYHNHRSTLDGTRTLNEYETHVVGKEEYGSIIVINDENRATIKAHGRLFFASNPFTKEENEELFTSHFLSHAITMEVHQRLYF